jgi:hypothetical protein
MKATLLTIASTRNEAIRFAQNVAKTNPAATYPSASVSMACCIKVTPVGLQHFGAGWREKKLACGSRSLTNFRFSGHRAGVVIP